MPFDALAGLDYTVRKNNIRCKAPRHKSGPVLRLVCFGAGNTGTLILDNRHFACALGRNGRSYLKREGDGATPRGRFKLRSVFYRADRGRRPVSLLPVLRLNFRDSWCDDHHSRLYNRPTRRINPNRGETLWRDDGLYDVVVPLGFNDMTVKSGGGSAIFFHLVSGDNAPTEGCIAVSRRDMDKILSACGNTGSFYI